VSTPGFRPRITKTAHDAVIEHVFSSPGHEVGGVLVGRIVAADRETVVSGAIAALEATSERASVTFTHDAWSTVHATLEREFPGQAIVGWYHSHPGFGIFLSDHDTFIQTNFFSNEGQIAHVVDPQAGTEGLFGWREGEIRLIAERDTRREGLGGPRRTPPEGEARPGGEAVPDGKARPRGEAGPGAGSGPGAGPGVTRAVADAPAVRAPSVPAPTPTASTMTPAVAGGPAPDPGLRLRVGLAVLVGLALGFGGVAAAKADPSPSRPVPGALVR
jgi:proteasome lid subunit RPN8/RPN11